MILIHISGDQLARAPEILSLQYSNSIKSGLRNIFYENDLICFVIYYHKDYFISEITKIIYRYLSREIGELLVYYLWLIVLFLQRIYEDQTSNRIFSLYLFQKISLHKSQAIRIISDDLRRILRRETEIELEIAINSSQYRYIAIEISRKFLKKNFRFKNDKFDHNVSDQEDYNFDDNIVDLQADYSTRISELIYARDILERSDEIADLKSRFREISLVSDIYIFFIYISNSLYLFLLYLSLLYLFLLGLYEYNTNKTFIDLASTMGIS